MSHEDWMSLADDDDELADLFDTLMVLDLVPHVETTQVWAEHRHQRLAALLQRR